MSDAMVEDTTKKQWVSDRLQQTLLDSFGLHGDFKVLVPQRAGEKDERKEFKVWSVILSSWSDVFEKMMSHDLKEKAERELVIQDFSPEGVEAFLRFLYSGTLNTSLGTLVEVLAIADKYQTPELPNHCQDILTRKLSAETAWDLFVAADRFRLEQLRDTALHTILRSPKVALAKRPSVDEELLVEVLSSHLLCISDDDLCDLLFNWEDPIGDATRNLIEKCVPNISPEKREKLRSSNSAGEPEQKRLKLVRSMHGARSEYTEDLILSIKGRFDKKWGMRNDVTEQEPQAFLSNWVSVLYSRSQNVDAIYLWARQAASYMHLLEGNWFEWRFPYFTIVPQALKFTSSVPAASCFSLLCGNDSTNLQEVFSSKELGRISCGQVIKCKCDFPVQRLRVFAVQKDFNLSCIKFQGYLQEIAD
ncbi:BTB and MATH domain-containing protein 40 [Durusdinium trenchii]|uniref:BTB and MATH domain-containing protein 40 n=1 Tax=Durusdinium trenchii TaxID=1381693 RepID=A0ABP0RNL3_9DINO